MTDLEKKEKRKEYSKKYRENNKEYFKEYLKEYDKNRDKNERKLRVKIYREKNKEKVKKYDQEYYKKNKEKILQQSNEYKNNNKQKTLKNNNNYKKKRRQIDPLYKLAGNIRILIKGSIRKQGYTKQTKTFEILGCSYEEFKQHLERQFKKDMNWKNHGQWHLDHIYPISLAKDEAELIKLNHYTNFQPMWAAENISKGNKIIPNTQIKLI